MSNVDANNPDDDIWILQKDLTHDLTELYVNNPSKELKEFSMKNKNAQYTKAPSAHIPLNTNNSKNNVVTDQDENPTKLPNYHCTVTSVRRKKKSKPKSRLVMFCESISIRGFHKIVRAPSKFVKVVWISFVILMTILLIITSYFLLNDFFNYNTAWQTSTVYDERTAFPAISICSHNPFSIRAKDMWADNSALSPQNFRNLLLNTSLKLINYTRGQEVLYDSADFYYGNIKYEDSVKLSHTKDILRYCKISTKISEIVSDKCNFDNIAMRIRTFSTAKYYNCFTIEENPDIKVLSDSVESVNNFLSLIILIQLTPESDLPQLNDGFPMDSLTRGTGIKLVIHEMGTYPEIESDGINLQPGKMNEINFETVHWLRYNSPKNPCMNNLKEIKDLGVNYKYTLTKCLENELQKGAIKECGCMNPLWPRIHIPSAKYPYCSNYNASIETIVKRYKCKAFVKVEKKKDALVNTKCFGACSYFTYESKVSVTNWKPSMKKLNYVRKANEWIEHRKMTSELLRELVQINNHNYTNMDIEILKNETRFCYVNVVRRNYDTITKMEKLVIDVSIFMSRVGGLCSLFIGLTTAVVAELVEFFYMAFYRKSN